jgi:hypothetical protein
MIRSITSFLEGIITENISKTFGNSNSKIDVNLNYDFLKTKIYFEIEFYFYINICSEQ